ncbi:MAG: glycine/betaine/sarcosine/D-proline family reductase selenoprotein B [Oscillospiraceae bacterium]|nr:glycine/betaine/sarcosine/D-proline family reductase selenoprotein B [Oscillospiraceae bacterium]
MADKLRVVHYINQFFGQIGGEDAANSEIIVEEKPIGPGIGINSMLAGRGEIVATIICGDNYIAEDLDAVTEKVVEIVKQYEPDIFFAGPAFNAGRYGVACGSVCAAVKKQLGIPAVTAMFEENPGREIYAPDICILKAADNARRMAVELKKMVAFGLSLYDGTIEYDPEKEGFFERGWMILKRHEERASMRAINMLMDKMANRPYKTEIPMQIEEKIPAPAPLTNLAESTIVLITDGALCPQGNPEGMKTSTSTQFHVYSTEGKDSLTKEEYTCVHGGFDTSYVLADPNRLVPLDALRKLERDGVCKVHNAFLSTSGLTTPVTNSINIAKGMIEYVRNHGIDAAILTST